MIRVESFCEKRDSSRVTLAVALARPLHVSKVGQSKEKETTKQVTHISDFHAYGSKSSLWPDVLKAPTTA